MESETSPVQSLLLTHPPLFYWAVNIIRATRDHRTRSYKFFLIHKNKAPHTADQSTKQIQTDPNKSKLQTSTGRFLGLTSLTSPLTRHPASMHLHLFKQSSRNPLIVESKFGSLRRLQPRAWELSQNIAGWF